MAIFVCGPQNRPSWFCLQFAVENHLYCSAGYLFFFVFFFWGGVGVRESGGLLHYATQRGMSTCKSRRGRAKVNRLSLPMSQVAH